MVFDYRTPDCARRILAATGGVDRIVEVDVAGNAALWSEVVALNGSVIGYASRSGPSPAIPVSGTLMRKNVNLRGVVLNSAPAQARRQAMDDITRWLRQAPRLHRIAARFPLAETVAAHKAVESGTKRGTVVVVPGP
jgi:NADPH2:quinone reductase